MTASETMHCYKPSNYEPTLENIKIHRAIIDRIRMIKPRSVLEIGSGVGLMGEMIRHLDPGIRYVGVEPDDTQIGLAKSRCPELSFVAGSLYDDPVLLCLGKFDLVISTDVIEHLFLPRSLVTFAKAHLVPGGSVITCTPDFGSYWKNVLYSLFNKWDKVHSPLWDGGHIKFFSRDSMRQIFEEAGFVDFQWATVRNVNMPILPMSMICVCRH